MSDTMDKKRPASVAGLAVAGALLAPLGCAGAEQVTEPPPSTETPPAASVEEARPEASAGVAPEDGKGDAGASEEIEPDPKKKWPNPGGVRG